MNFDFTDDQQAIKRTANELLAARFKPERVRELAEAGAYDDDAWKEMSELGWAGIFIDEEHGGQGLGIVELIILMEELGYALAPLPFLSNAAAGLVLHAAGSDEQKERWLPGIASGELRGTVGLVTDGEAKLVPDAATAEVIVLCGHEGTEVVERSDAQIDPVRTMDPTRAFARVGANGAGRPLEGYHLPGLSLAALALAAHPPWLGAELRHWPSPSVEIWPRRLSAISPMTGSRRSRAAARRNAATASGRISH